MCEKQSEIPKDMGHVWFLPYLGPRGPTPEIKGQGDWKPKARPAVGGGEESRKEDLEIASLEGSGGKHDHVFPLLNFAGNFIKVFQWIGWSASKPLLSQQNFNASSHTISESFLGSDIPNPIAPGYVFNECFMSLH